MMLKVMIPEGDAAFRGGFIAAWHKKEGDRVEFGDDICDVAIDTFMALQRTKRATLLGSSSRLRKRRVKDGYSLREGRGQVIIRLTSAEGGLTLDEIVVSEGDRIEIGSLVALLSSMEDGGSRDIEAAREARIAVNMPDAADVDPFD